MQIFGVLALIITFRVFSTLYNFSGKMVNLFDKFKGHVFGKLDIKPSSIIQNTNNDLNKKKSYLEPGLII
jgi:hypothetical protein